jgi:hypothetical protein
VTKRARQALRLCLSTECGVSEHAKDENQKWRCEALLENGEWLQAQARFQKSYPDQNVYKA